MSHRSQHRARLAAAVLAVSAGAAAVSHAQPIGGGGNNSGRVAPLTPPRAQVPDNPGMFMTYLSLLVVAAGIVGANLIPSKRGHQD